MGAATDAGGRLYRYATVLAWALPVWAVLLFYGTLTHQPDPGTQFADWARYVTTREFFASHIVASILGAAIGTLGFVALAAILAIQGASRIALAAMITAIVGNTLVTAVFGTAAFAQPAMGRAFLTGRHAAATAFYNDVYGTALIATTALPGTLLLAVGAILFGIGVARTRPLPAIAGIGLAVGGPLFSLVGVALADFVQSIAAALLVVSTGWIAWAARSARPAA